MKPRRIAAGRPGRRRALFWVSGALGLAVLLAAGTVYAVREKLFVPSHQVPGLAGLTVASAEKAVHRDHFTIVVAGRAYSTRVASGRIIRQSPKARKTLKEGGYVHVAVSRGLPPERVPSLLGIDCTAAQRILSVADLYGTCPPSAAQYSTMVPDGQVITWTYQGTSRPRSAPWHSTIIIAISNGPPPVMIPRVMGMTYAQAVAAISQRDLEASETRQSSLDYPAGRVVGTSPAQGQQLPEGSTVTVYVSSGSPFTQFPFGLLGRIGGEGPAARSAPGNGQSAPGNGQSAPGKGQSAPGNGQSVPGKGKPG